MTDAATTTDDTSAPPNYRAQANALREALTRYTTTHPRSSMTTHWGPLMHAANDLTPLEAHVVDAVDEWVRHRAEVLHACQVVRDDLVNLARRITEGCVSYDAGRSSYHTTLANAEATDRHHRDRVTGALRLADEVGDDLPHLRAMLVDGR